MRLLRPIRATVTPSTAEAKQSVHEYNRIPSFPGFELNRFDLNLVGIDDDDPEPEAEDFTIGFSSTEKEPKKALKELMRIIKISLEIDREENYSNPNVIQSKEDKDYTSPTLKDIEMSSVGKFIQAVSPEKEHIPFEDFSLLEDYRYLHYSTCKWASEMLSYNLESVLFAETFDELEDTLMKLVPEDAPQPDIPSTLTEDDTLAVSNQPNIK